MSTTLQVFETRTLMDLGSATGANERDFYVATGSRMLITLLVTAIDPSATIDLYIDNSFNADVAYDTIETLSLSATGRVKKILSDFHSIFKLRAVITNGNATFKVGISIFDNALSTRIENASISADLHHTTDSQGNFDSVRIGNGSILLGINPDGSLNTNIRDDDGDPYTLGNPLPVTTGFEKFFTLIAASKWMELANYDEIIPTYTNGNTTLTMQYLEDDAILGEVVVNFTSLTDWDMKLNRYITDDDGIPLTDDDDTELNLD